MELSRESSKRSVVGDDVETIQEAPIPPVQRTLKAKLTRQYSRLPPPRPNAVALFRFHGPTVDDSGMSVVKVDAKGNCLDDQPMAPMDPKQAILVPIRDRGTAINAWTMLRKRFALPKIMQELGLHRLDMGQSSAEITLADLQMVSERIAARFGWDPRDKIVEKGSESVTTRSDDMYNYTQTTGMYHSVRVTVHLEFPHHDPRVKRENVDPTLAELPWPEHTYRLLFADTTHEDFTASSAIIDNQRQLARVLGKEPAEPSTRREKLADFLQAKMLMADTAVKTEGLHGLWELSLNRDHHGSVSSDVVQVLVANLSHADSDVLLPAVCAVWALSTSAQPRSMLAELGAVPALYKLLRGSLLPQVTTAAQYAAQDVADSATRRQRRDALRVEMAAAEVENANRRAAGRVTMLPIETVPPDTPEDVEVPPEVAAARAEMLVVEQMRDRMQRAVLGALNMMMIDRRCRQQVLPVDNGLELLLKLCAALPGYSDGPQRLRRAAASRMLCNLVMRDVAVRQALIPGVLPKLLDLLHAEGPGSHDVCHYVSATLHVYVLDADCIQTMAAADLAPKGSKQRESGVARLVKQCLQSLDHMVERLETNKTGSMSLQEVVTICERNSLSMWASCKQSSLEDTEQIGFHQMELLCRIIQRWIRLPERAKLRHLALWRVGHNLNCALSCFAIQPTAAKALMGVGQGNMTDMPTILAPDSACACLAAFTSPCYREGFVRASALTGVAFLAAHAVAEEGDDAMVGVYRRQMLATGLLPTTLASMAAQTDNDQSRTMVLRCGAVSTMFLATEAGPDTYTMSSWELFTLLAIATDVPDITVVEALMAALWALMRQSSVRWMLREPMPAEQLTAATEVVERIRTQRCITAADLRDLFSTMTDRREGGDGGGGGRHLGRSNSDKSLWGTRDEAYAQRALAEENGSLAEPATGDAECAEGAEASEGWEEQAEAVETAQEAGVAHGPEVQMGEDQVIPGVFASKAKGRKLNPAQWLCTAEHHAGKWWGIRQLFRVWDQWKHAILQAGDPNQKEGWKSLIKANEFLVTNLWSYLVADDISVPSRRSHVSQKDRAPGMEQEFWWMVEVNQHKVDLDKHPLLVKALEILLWVAALPHHRHWTARQLALGALWNMAVRRPAVEEWLIRNGILQLLVDTIQGAQTADGSPLWPTSLRDLAAMMLGDLMTEYEMLQVQQTSSSALGAPQIHSAVYSLVAANNPRLQVCGLRVLGRLCYQAPLGHPKPERFLTELRTLLAHRGCCGLLIRMLNRQLLCTQRMSSPGGHALSVEASMESVHAMSMDTFGSDDVGPLAMMAHAMRLLRNLSLDFKLQGEIAALGLPTLFRINHFLSHQIDAANAGQTVVGPLHFDVVHNCSALLYNLSSHPENRTRFYKMELAQSAMSEADRTVEKKRLVKQNGTYAHMGPRPITALPPQPAAPTLELGTRMRMPISPTGRPGVEVTPSGASTPRTRTMASHSDATSMLSFKINKTSSGFHAAKPTSLVGERLPPGTRTVTSPSGRARSQSPSSRSPAAPRTGSPVRRLPTSPSTPGSPATPSRVSRRPLRPPPPSQFSPPMRLGTAPTHAPNVDSPDSPWAALTAELRARTAAIPHEPPTVARPSPSLTREIKVRPINVATVRRQIGGGHRQASPSSKPTQEAVVRTLDMQLSGSEPKEAPVDDGSDTAKCPASYKTSFMEWEKSTFDQDFVMRIVDRMSPHRHLSKRIATIAQPKIKWDQLAELGVKPHGLEKADKSLALPDLSKTLGRPMRYLWRPCKEEEESMMGNNKWAPAIHHYREIKPTSGAPLRMSSTVEPLITTAYPKFAMHDLAEAKQIIESNLQGSVPPEVVKRRPPSAKLKGGRKPRTLLDMKSNPAALASAPDSEQSEFDAALAPPHPSEFARARSLVSFLDKWKFSVVDQRRPKLHMFEHFHGARVYDGLFPDYQLPNGRKAFFCYESKLLDEVEVTLRECPEVPSTLSMALQWAGTGVKSRMPMNINLHANTKVPGMAPPMEVLKPVPEAPPLPLRHTLHVKQPQLLTDWRAFADLEDRPLTLRVLATPYKMHRSLTKKTRIQVSDRPPWQLETSIFKARKQESEGKAFLHATRMTERMVGVDWGARLCSKEKFTSAILREWGKDGLSADERLQKLGQAVEKHYGVILRVFDFYCSLGSGNPYQMSLNAFSSFCEESAITDNESQYCKKSDLDTLFIIAKSFSTAKGSKLDKVKDANCLMRFEFIEALVRIAVAKIGKIENVDPADALDLLMETVVEPNLHPYACVDRDTFRRERLYNEETDLVLTENAAVLQAVWSAFRCRPDGGGLRTKGLSMKGFLDFMDKAHLYDEMFGYQEARLAFLWSRTHSSDEAGDWAKYTSLTFTDFMEALGRIADIRMVPTDEELEELGWGGPGEGSRFKWMLAVENGESSRVIPRRLSANGIGSTSHRPLADKLYGLIEMLCERLFYNPHLTEPFTKDRLRKMMVKQDKERAD